MILTVYLLLITQLFFTTSEPIDEGSDVGEIKIRNGRRYVVNPGKFAYLAHMEIMSYIPVKNPKRYSKVYGNFAGTLIKNDVILTAAHCIQYPKMTRKITAWLGVLDTKLEEGEGQEIPVKGFTIHGAYIRANGDLNNLNDIALLFLKHPARVDGKFVKLANLPSKDFDAVNKKGYILGWGEGSCGKKTTMLQKAKVKGVSSTECQESYTTTKISFTFICVLCDNRRATSTQGDSGGPFVIGDTVLGISSFGAVDLKKSDLSKDLIVCDAKKPSVYTYVPLYLVWIERSAEEGPEVLIKEPISTQRPPTTRQPATGRPPARVPTRRGSLH